MTIDEFLKELGKINVEWYSNRRGRLRCRLGAKEHCPITAVALNKLGLRFSVRGVTKAGRMLGLSNNTGYKIANAADHPEPYYLWYPLRSAMEQRIRVTK